MSIELKNVTYTYSPGTAYEIHALKDINLSIPDGQFIGIIGHTGSGKSTLIQHFNALIRPTSGTITYNGDILTSLVAGQQVDFEDIHCEGITKITPEDIKYAKAMHRAIKLLASSRKVGDSYTCLVAPYMIDDTHPLSGVNGVFNGVFLRGNVLGDAMFYGSGAGKLPTASAVVADVVDMTKHQNTNIYIDWKPEKLTLVSYDDSVNSFFVRTDSPKSAQKGNK